LTQRASVEETFHQFSQASSTTGDKSSQDWTSENTLNKEMAYAATKEIIESWDLTMTEAQEKRFREDHFEPTWSKYAKLGYFSNDHISNQYATAFIKDIATITKKE